MRMRTIAIVAITLLALSVSGAGAAPNSVAARIDLSGKWSFSVDPTNTGLQKGWYGPDHDISKWSVIKAPGKWESQGIVQFNPQWKGPQTEPYDGYAWYFRSVVIPPAWKGKTIYLNLGRIDDVDWTYVNGALVGNTGSMDKIAPQDLRVYEIPADLVRFGKPNLIAIRALDRQGDGGIMTGPLSLTLSAPEAASSQPGGEGAGDEDANASPGNVNVGSDVIIKAGERVTDAVAIGGDVDISGEVLQDATAIGGDVIVRRSGRVGGGVTSIGGDVTREPGSKVRGDVVSTSIPGLSHMPFLHHGGLFSMGVSGFIASLFFIVIAVVLAALVPKRIDTIATTAYTRPGWSALYGILAALLIIPVGLFLLVTVIGIPLLPIWLIIVWAAFVIGRTAATVELGRRLAGAVGKPIASIVLAAFVGGLLWAVVRLVPFAGVALLLILSLLGFGATWITMFGSHPDWFANRRSRSSGQPDVREGVVTQVPEQ